MDDFGTFNDNLDFGIFSDLSNVRLCVQFLDWVQEAASIVLVIVQKNSERQETVDYSPVSRKRLPTPIDRR